MVRLVQGEDGAWREPPGQEALWGWFGLSRASWLTMPRVLMHAMPDDWQAKMAALLEQYDATWDLADQPCTAVMLRRRGKLVRQPGWMDYRHPDEAAIAALKRSTD